MRIKTKLYISVATSLGLISILVLSSFQFSAEARNASEKAEFADELARGAAELSIIIDEYLAYHEVRMEQQWQSRFYSIMELIKKGKESTSLDIIRTNYESLDNSFSQLKTNYMEREELLKKNASQEEVDRTVILEERLAAQMRLDTQKILSNVFRISAEARQEADAIQQSANLLTSIFGVLIVFTMGTSTFFTIKSITRPIDKLIEGADIIGRGNLEHRIDIKSRDETGHLSQAFNEMAEALRKQREELKRYSEHLEELVKDGTRELSRANIRLEELDRLKSMFIASMSHELRTPLNSIIGFTGVVLQGIAGEITEEQRKQLTMVKNSANHLLALINDVIDVSKIEAGKIEPVIEEFNLSGLVKEVNDSFTVAAEKKGLKLILETPKELVIKSDERRTKQVIMNLVSNAVKFTDKGRIEIKVVKKDGGVEVSVRDTGIGVEKEDEAQLFKAFSRIHAEDVVKEGTGLGLYLSKKIADLLGGEISVESEFGSGSNFIFTLPLKYREVKI